MKKILGNKEVRELRRAIKENDRQRFNREVHILLKQAQENAESRENGGQIKDLYTWFT